jgi:CoA:oxalate CoA-transferase
MFLCSGEPVDKTHTGRHGRLPLAGITVLDLGQVFQGPYAAFLMAKAGADVIKIEPLHGEPLRRRSGADPAAAIPLAMLNTNKRAISLNLKSARGRELFLALARKADVVVENFAPGVMDRLSVGWSVLRQINPRLIYASGSGFGLSGPHRDNLAMDLTVQAFSGVMSVTGDPDGPPMKAGPAVVDFISGTHLYAAVVTALYRRMTTDEGCLVEVAMQEAICPTLVANLATLHSSKGKVPTRTGNRHGSLSVAPYNVYSTKDGFVALICEVDDHWHNLATAMGREELKDDPRFATAAARVKNIGETDTMVQSWTKSLGKWEVFASARQHRFPAAPVRELNEVINDLHMHERGMLQEINHPEIGRITVINSPMRFHGTESVETIPSPRHGQHNAEIYGDWLGLSPAEIAALIHTGVI